MHSARPIASWRFITSHPAHFISFGFGAGLSPIAPGTAGTLLGFALFALIARLPLGLNLMLLAALFALGAWAAQRTGAALGVADHGGICWDEIVAFVLVLLFTPPSVAWYAASFLLFRAFDIVKPFPIRYFDRKIKNGFGVMFDDLLAATYSVAALKIAERIFHA
jgi:phosphatidylglycerophosphatase A